MGVYTDGIQDGYPFVFQGRDNGVAYWGDFKAGIAKFKLSVGGFDGGSATGNSNMIGSARRERESFYILQVNIPCITLQCGSY